MLKKLLASFSALFLMATLFVVPVNAAEQKPTAESAFSETGPIGVPKEDIIVDRIAIDDYGTVVHIYVFSNDRYLQPKASRENLFSGNLYLTTDRADKIVFTQRKGFEQDTIECTPYSGGAVTFNCNGIEQAVDVGNTCQFVVSRAYTDINVSVRPNWYEGWYSISVSRLTGF